MSKARSMYAGSSGYNYGVNKNSPGNGNGKWQGLWPSVGHARNARLINTRAGGDNRNVVFCMNQLGGVGRISNMFASTADGVHNESCAHSAGSALGAVLAGSSEIAYDGIVSFKIRYTLSEDEFNNMYAPLNINDGGNVESLLSERAVILDTSALPTDETKIGTISQVKQDSGIEQSNSKYIISINLKCAPYTKNDNGTISSYFTINSYTSGPPPEWARSNQYSSDNYIVSFDSMSKGSIQLDGGCDDESTCDALGITSLSVDILDLNYPTACAL